MKILWSKDGEDPTAVEYALIGLFALAMLIAILRVVLPILKVLSGG